MALHTWWAFVAMTFVVSATPGPNMMLVMSHGARFGVASSTFTMAGCMLALLCMMSLSAAGLGALLHTWPAVFDALRYAGAAYLAYLGVQQWRAPVPGPDAAADAAASHAPLPRTPTAAQGSARTLFGQGAAVAASNPKAIVFAAAFLPQFIAPQTPVLPQMATLLTTFVAIEGGWYWVYAACGQWLSRHLARPSVMRGFQRATGAVFVGFALWMALSS